MATCEKLVLYDSGIGGLSIIPFLRQYSPHISYTYIADTAMFPLGEYAQSDIIDRMCMMLSHVFSRGATLVVLVCNSATVNAIRYIQDIWLPRHTFTYPVNVLGVSTPLLELLHMELSHHISQKGVIVSTQATHRSHFYEEECQKRGFDSVHSIPCNTLASYIEVGSLPDIVSAIEKCVQHPASIDWVALACTHYHWAYSQFQHVLPHARIIDPTQFIAQRLSWYINTHSQYNITRTDINSYWYTGHKPTLSHTTLADVQWCHYDIS